MYEIKIPDGAREILSKLKQCGFDGYVFGGCVRDSLLGLAPKDWDICTDASPAQVEEAFAGRRIIETGIKHGTVTIIMDDGQYEVTTFRVDGGYSDNRHPDNVTFVKDVREDLARRDFTINAMAYDGDNLIDCFGGAQHLESGIISCVGNVDDRFNEDALRIMRALRFASVYGFSIDDSTSEAIHRNAHLLNRIAAERINAELCKLLCGDGVLQVLLDYSDVIAVIVPEMKPCIGFDQNNRYHQYIVYDHIAHAVANCNSNSLSVRLALFLHDIGKPLCYTEDENGGHFHGHAVPSHDIARMVLDRLKFDNKTKSEVLELVLYHDSVIEPTTKTVRRWLSKIGEERFYQLMAVREADIRAHAEGTQESRLDRFFALYPVLEGISKEEMRFKLSDMNINGNDIMALGVPEGKQVGTILKALFDKIIDGDLKNEHDVLLAEVKRISEVRQ